MVGLGMIFDETYRPLFEQLHADGLYRRDFGLVDVELAAVASRTGSRAERYRAEPAALGPFASFAGPDAVAQLLAHGVDVVCVATPDDRHFEAARLALAAGKHVLIEKPSVLRLQELDELDALARSNGVLAKVVYHKLADPDHKKLRTHVVDGVLRHVNNGYCSLLEPKSISGSQFAEWITGRNPGTYVAVHYIKLIDFTFGAAVLAPGPHRRHRPARPGRPGRRPDLGLGATADGLRLPRRPRGRLRHPHQLGHARQLPRLRRAGGAVPLRQRRLERPPAQARRRGDRRGPHAGRAQDTRPTTITTAPSSSRGANAASAATASRSFAASSRRSPSSSSAGRPSGRGERLQRMRGLTYNDLSADRPVVATVQAMEAILRRHAEGQPGCQAVVNGPLGGLVLQTPGEVEPMVLYEAPV